MHTLTENLGWKLASVVIATGFWLTLSGQTEVATSVPAAVRYRNVPTDLELSSDHVDRLFLKLRGPATRLAASSLAQTTLVLDLGNALKPGEQTFTITKDNLTLPPGVTLIRVVPSQVRVRLERRSVKDVPIEVRFAGPPPPGYRVVRQSVEPASVRIVGPESRLEQIASLQTDPVDLSAELANAEFRVPIFLADPQVRFEQPQPLTTVRVTLEKIPQGNR
jgi:YbbR domain-containing protein